MAPVVDEIRRNHPQSMSTPEHHALARRNRQDRSVLALAFFDCWERAGLSTALDIVRRHGAVEGLRGLNFEQLGRATGELEATVRLVRGL